MKKLLLLFFFSGSLDSFSQVKIDTVHIGGLKLIFRNDTLYNQIAPVEVRDALNQGSPKPDTLRAIILVTLTPNGIAHARMGFVVIAEGKEVKYLDCRKNALKLPQVGWRYRVVGENEKIK